MSTLIFNEATAADQVLTPPDGESRIDRDSHFNGRYETKQNLRIEGLAEGEIQCQGTLTVAEGARVQAKVTARTITIAGELDGEVVCHGVFQILPTGQVQAKVSAHRLIVQEGGIYNGEFRMISAAAPAPAPAPSIAESYPEVETPKAKGSKAKAPKVIAEESEPELGSDEWWEKMSKGELAPGGDKSEEEPKEDSS